MIRANILRVRQEIGSVCKTIGRNPDEVVLIGVTKYAEPPKIQEAIDAGLEHIAENRVQEGKRKFPVLKQASLKLTRHLIGHLQTNKAKQAMELFDLIQSVDSVKLAKEIDRQAAGLNKKMDVLLQVNTSGEEQKFGVAPAGFNELLDAVKSLNNLNVLGLMTMAPFTEDETVIRDCFKKLKEIFEQVKKSQQAANIQMRWLSMGMSSDFKIAIEEGANMVRIGTAIFKEKE